MIRKNRGETTWLEFNLLQGSRLSHGVYLKESRPNNDIQLLDQVHGKEVVTLVEMGPSPIADGAITKTKGLALGIRHADCQAAIFYDPITEALATIHAGWRGLVQNIYKEAVQNLNSIFQVKPENLIVCIGPSLEPEHAEFIHYKQEFPEQFWRFQASPNHFNMWEIAKFQLTNLGISPQNIEIAEIGTYGNQDDFYSYRRAKDTLRNFTVATLS